MKKGAHVEWFSTADAATYLGFPSTRAFEAWIARQRAKGTLRLKVHRLGDRMRFRRTDLDALLEPEALPESTRPRLTLVGGSR